MGHVYICLGWWWGSVHVPGKSSKTLTIERPIKLIAIKGMSSPPKADYSMFLAVAVLAAVASGTTLEACRTKEYVDLFGTSEGAAFGATQGALRLLESEPEPAPRPTCASYVQALDASSARIMLRIQNPASLSNCTVLTSLDQCFVTKVKRKRMGPAGLPPPWSDREWDQDEFWYWYFNPPAHSDGLILRVVGRSERLSGQGGHFATLVASHHLVDATEECSVLVWRNAELGEANHLPAADNHVTAGGHATNWREPWSWYEVHYPTHDE